MRWSNQNLALVNRLVNIGQYWSMWGNLKSEKKVRKNITKVTNQKFMHCIFHKLSLTQESINCSITPPPLLQKPLRLPPPETVGQTVGASVDRLQPE